MIIRAAEDNELALIMAMRKNAAEWLHSIGSDQWSDAGLTDTIFTQRVAESIVRRETWVICTNNGAVIGTVAIDHETDSGLWSPDERAESVFLHRMIIDRNHAGHGVGTVMLNWANIVAVVQNRRWLRLDAWTSNTALHRYYEHNGFRHVRTVREHKSPSAALFERRVLPPAVDSLIPAPIYKNRPPLTTLEVARLSDQAAPWGDPHGE